MITVLETYVKNVPRRRRLSEYGHFSLDEISDADARLQFRYEKSDICLLWERLGIPDIPLGSSMFRLLSVSYLRSPENSLPHYLRCNHLGISQTRHLQDSFNIVTAITYFPRAAKMSPWTKFIPRALFTAKDGSPICALLDMQDSSAIEILTEMFETRGGSIVSSKSATEYAIILTDRTRGHSRITTELSEYPIFDVEWIVDCIDFVELVNINPYLKNRDIFGERDFMKVIFDKLETSKGTLMMDHSNSFSDDDWKTSDQEKSRRKKTRRRGPPKKEDYVVMEINSLSAESDVYCELTDLAVTQAIESILLNERILIAQTKEQLKRHDPDFENRIFSKNLQSTVALLTGFPDTDYIADKHVLQPSSHHFKESDIYRANQLTMKNLSPRNSLRLSDGVLPISSRVLKDSG
ncbi:hypothetical protein GE061_015042 [Apolygus lucorum]|uniref:BRCT domain-containing protein n=1 Tax=Apolygus lucorum TaxID=248454 RepID=A0A8S9XJZ2_APOLU|nr:hypothetical protein GE061_015042 [Apolygus lucorum]